MASLIRCKACGYITKEGKVKDVCPACGVLAKEISYGQLNQM